MVLSLYFLFHQWELFADAQGRRLLPNLVNLWCYLFGIIFYFSCHYFVSAMCWVFPLKVTIHGRSTIHMNSKHLLIWGKLTRIFPTLLKKVP